MALERRGNGLYFYRKVRVGDKVISQYAGSGFAAIANSHLDGEDRAKAFEAKHEVREKEEKQKEILCKVAQFYAEVDLEVTKTLEVAGYHRHKRGEWRKKRT